MTVSEERRRSTVKHRSWVPGFGPATIIGTLGASGVIVSLFLPWQNGGIHPSSIPIAFLWDGATRSSDPSLLVLLVPLAVVLIVGALTPIGATPRVVGAIGVLIVTGVFAYQLDQEIATFPGTKLSDVLDAGVYVATIGGILAFVSAVLPTDAR
jgi:hypothetical protein